MRNCDIIVGASPNPPKPAETQLVWTSNLGKKKAKSTGIAGSMAQWMGVGVAALC